MMLLFDGLFEFLDDGSVYVSDQYGPAGVLSVSAGLTLLVGHEVQIALSHVPTVPLDPTLRGLGSCQADKPCPYGHDTEDLQSALYGVSATGTLLANPWRVVSPDGIVSPIRLDWMVGHRSRLACVSLTEMAKVRDSVEEITQTARAFSIGCTKDPV